jgi:hypothetical protein
MRICGFSCAFLHLLHMLDPFPSSRDHGEQERQGEGVLGLPLPCVTVPKLSPQHVRGKLLTPGYSHGPLAPAFLLSRAPPIRDYGYLHWGGDCWLA